MCIWIYTFKCHCRKKLKKYNLAKPHFKRSPQIPTSTWLKARQESSNECKPSSYTSCKKSFIYRLVDMTCDWHKYIYFWKWLCIIVVRGFMETSHYRIEENKPAKRRWQNALSGQFPAFLIVCTSILSAIWDKAGSILTVFFSLTWLNDSLSVASGLPCWGLLEKPWV